YRRRPQARQQARQPVAPRDYLPVPAGPPSTRPARRARRPAATTRPPPPAGERARVFVGHGRGAASSIARLFHGAACHAPLPFLPTVSLFRHRHWFPGPVLGGRVFGGRASNTVSPPPPTAAHRRSTRR